MSKRFATTQWNVVLAARDLTQAFFADLLSRDFLGAIDESGPDSRPSMPPASYIAISNPKT